MKKSVLGLIVIVLLMNIFILNSFILAEDDKTCLNNPETKISGGNQIDPDDSKAWSSASSQQRMDYWISLSDDQKTELWNNFCTPQKAQFIFDMQPENRKEFWKWMKPEDRDMVWYHLDSTNKDKRNQLWKELDKKDRNELWFKEASYKGMGGHVLDDNVRTELFQSLGSLKEKQEMVEQILSSDFIVDKLKRRGTTEIPDIKIDLSKADLNNLKFKFVNGGHILLNPRGDGGSFMRLDEANPYLKKVSFLAEGRIVNDYDGLKISYDTGSVDHLGNVLNNFNKVMESNGEYVNVIQVGRGEIEINGKKRDSRNYVEFVMREGSEMSIGSHKLKQFYGRYSRYDDYKPRDENGNIIDEDAVVRLFDADSPLYGDSFVDLKNTILSTYEGDKYLGDVYTSRGQNIKFFYTKGEKVVDAFNPKFDSYYDIDSAKNPIIEINYRNGKIDLNMIGDYYMGFIAQEGVEVGNTYMNGVGKEKEGLGHYIYFRNGDLGTSVERGDTHISGNTGKVDVSVDKLVNGRDSNANNALTIEKKADGSRVYTQDRTVTLATNIWKDSPRLADVGDYINGFRKEMIAEESGVEIKGETQPVVPEVKTEFVPASEEHGNTGGIETDKGTVISDGMKSEDMYKIIEKLNPKAFKAE